MNRFVVLAGCSLSLVVSTAATAQLSFPSRISSMAIDTARKDFSDAKATITTTTQAKAGSTGSTSLDFYTTSNLTSLATKATGAVSADLAVQGQDPDDYGFAEIAGTVTATGPAGGGFSLIENFRAATDPFATGPLYRYADGGVYQNPVYSFLPAFTQTNLPSLELFLPIGGAGLVDQGGLFVFELSIGGDYSTTAGLNSGTGQHYLNVLNPGWTITSNFVYDATANLTTFRAERANYDYANEGALGLELDAYFFGTPAAAVPEPATWATMTLGMILVGMAIRRRERAGRLAAA